MLNYQRITIVEKRTIHKKSENISILFWMILENAQPNARAGALNLKEEKPVKRMAGICRM